MGGTSSTQVFYRVPSLESSAAALLLTHLPEWKSASFTPYVCGRTDAEIINVTKVLPGTKVVFLGVTPPSTVLSHLGYSTKNITVVSHLPPPSSDDQSSLTPFVKFVYICKNPLDFLNNNLNNTVFRYTHPTPHP
jgi:hypothetical protein